MSPIPAYRPPKVPVGPDKPGLFRYLRTVVDNPIAGIPAAAYREPIALRVLPVATFAMMEMVAALATLLQNVRLATAEGTRCEPVHRITLRPKGGMVLNISGRCD